MSPPVPPPWPAPISLSAPQARLEPLAAHHAPDLARAAADGDLHRLWYTDIPAPDAVVSEIARRRALQAAGQWLPFAVIDPASGRAVGMTSYLNIDATHRRVEIGSTWYARSAQRGPLNTVCKLLLLTHAFEHLDCIAVEFRTHVMNRQSRAAIERLGARLDGVLRAHRILADGSLRDTAVYSVTASDWPAVKTNLIWLRDRPRD